jgi:hypothetical protein
VQNTRTSSISIMYRYDSHRLSRCFRVGLLCRVRRCALIASGTFRGRLGITLSSAPMEFHALLCCVRDSLCILAHAGTFYPQAAVDLLSPLNRTVRDPVALAHHRPGGWITVARMLALAQKLSANSPVSSDVMIARDCTRDNRPAPRVLFLPSHPLLSTRTCCRHCDTDQKSPRKTLFGSPCSS